MWDFDIYKIGVILLPHAKRKVRFIAWMKVFFCILLATMESLRVFRQITDLDAKMTPQIIYLEKYLNDLYNQTQIRIVEGFELGPWCFYSGPPSGEVDMYMVEPDNYCYSSFAVTNCDFVVEVPAALELECNAIAAIVQKFKLAGKTFIIQLI